MSPSRRRDSARKVRLGRTAPRGRTRRERAAGALTARKTTNVPISRSLSGWARRSSHRAPGASRIGLGLRRSPRRSRRRAWSKARLMTVCSRPSGRDRAHGLGAARTALAGYRVKEGSAATVVPRLNAYELLGRRRGRRSRADDPSAPRARGYGRERGSNPLDREHVRLGEGRGVVDVEVEDQRASRAQEALGFAQDLLGTVDVVQLLRASTTSTLRDNSGMCSAPVER